MRSKEEAHDYRYFPDPDLLPLAVSAAWIEEARASLPELPQAKRRRYEGELGLTAYDAATLTQSRELAEYFEAILDETASDETASAAGGAVPAKIVANWVTGEFSARLNSEDKDASQSAVSPARLGRLLARIQDGTISGKIAKDVFDAMWAGEGEPDAIIERRGLRQISDVAALEAIVAEVLAANARSVEEFRAGKERAFNALVGQVMKATKGKANPQQVNDLLKKKLAG
jgi:aspartyl-tRNA(Asn)/glutamyl-tRNA(Gln) amidotransferase subunit B